MSVYHVLKRSEVMLSVERVRGAERDKCSHHISSHHISSHHIPSHHISSHHIEAADVILISLVIPVRPLLLIRSHMNLPYLCKVPTYVIHVAWYSN